MSQPERRPVVLRGGTVLTVDAGHTVLEGHDVLVVDDRIAGVGVDLEVPAGTEEIDARGGIVMPGMVDTHRHMWQTAMRGYGADWTLTQYFVWYYLEHGRKFRPQDVHAGNLVAAIEAIDAGVTTCVDWSHGLQTTQHADAAVDALAAVPGRFLLAYGNIQDAPANWTGTSELRDFLDRRRGDVEGFQLAFDVTGDPSFPEKPAFEVARDLGLPVTTHAGVWGATNDDGIRLMYEHGFMAPETIYVHAATLSRRLVPPDRGHRRIGVGVHRERAERRPGLPAHLGAAQPRHPGVPVDGHLGVVVGRPVHRDAHDARRRPLPRAPRGPRPGRDRHPRRAARRARRRHGHPRRRPGPGARGRPRQRRGGQEGRPRADPQRALAGELPDPAPARARRVPGPARRRREPCSSTAVSSSATTASSASTWPPHDARWRRRSTTCAASSARTSGARA